jgi:hypothetical protein
VYQPIAGIAYQRETLRSQGGAEVVQVNVSVAGNMPITLSTQQNGTGAFATTLAELALLGLLEGATLTVDQAVVTTLPATPVQAASATYGVLSPDPVRKFSGVVRVAQPDGVSVSMEAVDTLILGGGNVPRSAYSPLCRWEFCGAQLGTSRCIKPMKLADTGQLNVDNRVWTHAVISNVFLTVVNSTLSMPYHIRAAAWGFLVPQDGPMMGMRIQLGRCISSPDTGNWVWEIADTIPWTWSCDLAMIEYQCNKTDGSVTNANDVYTVGVGCTGWAEGTVNPFVNFGGADRMPKPEAT